MFVDDAEFVVLDLSESGARVEKGADWNPHLFPGYATLIFVNGEEHSMSIALVRESEHFFAVSFSPYVSFGRMLNEQRRLWQKFPLRS